MSATTTRQYRRIREIYAGDTLPLSSALLTELGRYLNNGFAYRIAPRPCPAFAWLAGGGGFEVTPADTANRYLLPLGVLLCYPGYTQLRYSICVRRTAGADSATLRMYLDSQLYRGAAVIDTAAMTPRVRTVSHAITGGTQIFTAALTGVPATLVTAPVIGGLEYARVYACLALQAAGVGSTYQIHSIGLVSVP